MCVCVCMCVCMLVNLYTYLCNYVSRLLKLILPRRPAPGKHAALIGGVRNTIIYLSIYIYI